MVDSTAFTRIQRHLDRVAAILGLLAALAMLPVQLIVNHIYAQTIPFVLALACLLYLTGERAKTSTEPMVLPRWTAHALPSVVMFGAASLLVLAHIQGARTRLFYVLAAVASTLVLVQLFFLRDRDRHTGVLILQVISVGAVIRFAALETTAGFIGIDVWLHVPKFTQGIIESGSIQGMTQTSYGTTKYVMAPFYHLTVAVTSLVGAVPLRLALVLSLGLVMPFIVVFVYLTANLLVSERWALVAAALFAFSDAAVHWSIDLIPTSLGAVFFLAVLVMIVRIVQLRTGTAETLLIGLLFVGIAFTHQVSSFILLVFLAASWGTQLLIRTGLFDRPTGAIPQLGEGDLEAVSFSGYFVFNLGLLTIIWSLTPYHGRSFLETVVLFLRDAIGGGRNLSSGITSGQSNPPLFQFVIEQLHLFGFLLFLFGTTVGSLYAFKHTRRNQAVLTFVNAAVVMTAFTLLPPLVGVNMFLPGRWYVFLYAVMAILTAVGFGYLHSNLPSAALLAVILVFTCTFPLVMVASPNATLDRPVLYNEHPSLGFTQQDLTAARTIANTTTGSPEDPIYTDFPYEEVLNRLDTQRYSVARVPRGGPIYGETVIYRPYQTHGAPRFVGVNGTRRVYSISPYMMCNDTRDTVYDNGKVRMCQAGQLPRLPSRDLPVATGSGRRDG